MTNGEKFVTAQDRAEAYKKLCVEPPGVFYSGVHSVLEWLDLEAEEEKPLPCPFCGGEMDVSASKCAIHCVCGYSSPIDRNISKVIAANNRVAKKCREGME